jgi:hypothetical protein
MQPNAFCLQNSDPTVQQFQQPIQITLSHIAYYIPDTKVPIIGSGARTGAWATAKDFLAGGD